MTAVRPCIASLTLTSSSLTKLTICNRQYHHTHGLFESLGFTDRLLPELARVVVSSPATHHSPPSFFPTFCVSRRPLVRKYVEGDPLTTTWERGGLLQLLESRPIMDVGISFDVSDCQIVLSGTVWISWTKSGLIPPATAPSTLIAWTPFSPSQSQPQRLSESYNHHNVHSPEPSDCSRVLDCYCRYRN